MVEWQTIGNRVGADTRLQFLQCSREAVEVFPARLRREVDIASRRYRSALRDGGEGSDHDVLHAVLVEHRDDSRRVERGPRGDFMSGHESAFHRGCPPPDCYLAVAS